MGDAKHTPGPWVIDQEEPDTIITAADTELSICVVSCIDLGGDTRWRHGPTTTANANLIAAAPELLEALRAVCDQADERAAKTEAETGRPVVRSPAALAVYNLARAAIAKATGSAS